MAQPPSHLKLSTDYPEVGKKITLTYDSVGAPVGGKKDLAAIVYFFDNKAYPVADIALAPSGKMFKGEFTIPANAKAFALRVIADGKTDNNDDNGYLYQVFDGKQPVPGAYAMEGFANAGTGKNLGAMKLNMVRALSLYKKEFELHPELEKVYQDPYYYYLTLSMEDMGLAAGKIENLKKSNDEKDLLLAANILASQKKTTEAEAIYANIKNKFPNGIGNKNMLTNTILKEKDPIGKEELYKAYKTKYPSDDEENDERLKTQVAEAYLRAGNLVDFRRVEATLKSKQDLIIPLATEALTMARKGERLADAEQLCKQALDMTKPLIEKPQVIAFSAPSQVQRNNKYYYASFADTYASILFQQNKPEEALKYEELAWAGGFHNSGGYILILDALGKTDDVIKHAEESIKLGRATDIIKEKLKKNYIAKNGESGYEKYIADLLQTAKDEALAKLTASMIDEPAPDFTLTDLDGKKVSLASLKGKTVVVDFWATWCGPCKASFPGMQMAVNKYKSDPNVEFLFVDTWETAADYVTGVRNFITDNKYTFHVLIDDKLETGRQAKVVSAYGVTGIPTKFVIDKNGHIRFKYVGYSGSSDKVADEVSNMLELTANAGNEEAAAKPNTKEKSK
ncbi:hypothetical protein GCM10022392_00010 [Mucilaginibacter panaciglaebae]|uniref:Thioredoxin domain-containing protein n=2 Tax=Mucilaginibacter panaciglaebae TaxID=502331 RepID=A0ABP7W8B4_9SPHI